MEKDERMPLPALLLLLALLFSAGLNCYLLFAADDQRPLELDSTADARVAESELELRLAQSQLARCQAEQLRKDSVLVRLLTQTQSVKL